MYHFATLDEAQKAERRRLLDHYALMAQLSALAPLLIIQLYFVTCWISRKISSRSLDSIPRKGGAGRGGKGRGEVGGVWEVVVRIRTLWRRVAWWAGGRVEVRGLGLEWKWGEVVFGTIWTAWLLILSFAQTGDDYLHLTKRLGIIGASQLPLHYLFSLKTPYSPLQLLTCTSWEQLNRIHQLLGRIVALFFYAHTALYLNFFVQSNILSKKLREPVVILGLVAVLAFSVIGTTALSLVRRWKYSVFYAIHVGLAILVLPVLFFHVHHVRVFVWETLGVWIVHFVLRRLVDRVVTADIRVIASGSGQLLDIRAPIAGVRGVSHWKTGMGLWMWQPGQHVYLSFDPELVASSDLKGRGKRAEPSWWMSLLPVVMTPLRCRNPFTIASLPHEDGYLRLIAKVHDGATASLAAIATFSSLPPTQSTQSAAPVSPKISKQIPLILEGPYGLLSHSLTLLSYPRVLFIAGGVGATFTLPLFRGLLRDLSPGKGSRRRDGVKGVWVVKRAEELAWVDGGVGGEGGMEESELEGVRDRMSVYVTRGGVGGPVREEEHPGEKDGDVFDHDDDSDADDVGFGTREDGDGVEMARLLPATSANHTHKTVDSDKDKEQDKQAKGWTIHHGRPDIRALIAEVFTPLPSTSSSTSTSSSPASSSASPSKAKEEAAERQKVAIVVCGPRGLITDVRREIGVWIRREKGERDVWFWSEEFGL